MNIFKRKQALITEIKSKRKELDAIEDEIVVLELMEPEQRIAIFLHDMLCKSNHTDDCGWFYEIKNNEHNWERDTHKRWLDKSIAVDEYMKKSGIDEEQLFHLVHLTTKP